MLRNLLWGWLPEGGILVTRICWIWPMSPPWSPEGYNPVCAHCIRLYMVCATFLQTLSHWDPVSAHGQIDNFVSINPLLAQMPSTVHLYQMLQTYGTHSLRGSSHPHLVFLKLMFCIIYNYFMYSLTILDTYIILYACLLGTLCISTSYVCILCTFSA